MEQNYLSDIELYLGTSLSNEKTHIVITDDEAKHVLRVMRHEVGDIIFVTLGKGEIYKTVIDHTDKRIVSCKINGTYKYSNNLENITICIPRLKLGDRFEFALEKCVELGITNIIVWEAERSIAKGEKLDRWNKIAASAMKQSLRSILPKINFSKNLKSLLKEPNLIVFDQNGKQSLTNFITTEIIKDNHYTFVFGPEGGFSENEIDLIIDSRKLKLTENRLRAETAVITAASIISMTSKN